MLSIFSCLRSSTIESFPNYAPLPCQMRTIKCFNRPVILVDDLMHPGVRIKALDPLIRKEEIPIQTILVGVLSGYGKDLMKQQNYPVDSVYYLPTLRQWWDGQRETAQSYFNNVLHHEGQASHPLSPATAEEVVSRHLESPSMLCLLSLQDWLSIDEHARNPHPEEERINEPANPRHYWRWRMHLTIEQLSQDSALNEKIRGLIKTYGR